VPTEIFYSSGGSVKVVADVQDVADALEGGATVLDTNRFAGFRGDEAAAGERVVVRVASIAHASAISGP
jgi:hypothetical protein